MPKKLISIVTPLYNEEENVNELYRQISKVMVSERRYNFEIIAVEHGSTDSTFKKLLSINSRDKRLKILQLCVQDNKLL